MAHRIQSEHRSDVKLGALNRQLTQIASRVSAAIGSDFFRSMTEHLAKVLAADCVYIGEFVGGHTERVKTLAAWRENQSENFSFELAGSAALPIALGKPSICKSRAQVRFPSDSLLQKWDAHACVGIPLMNSRDLPAGLIMTVYRKPLHDINAPREILEIFAPRAADELERRQQEELLRGSEQRYRAFVEDNSDGMWRIEFEPPVSTTLNEREQLEAIYRDGHIAECNLAMARQLGAESPEHLVGMPLKDIGPLSSPAVRNATIYAIRAGYRFNTVETSPDASDGKRRYMLRTQWGIVENNLLRRLWGSTRDITELKQFEKALDEAEQKFSGLLQNLPLIVMIAQPSGDVEFWNDRLSRPTGWKSSDVDGRNWIDLMIPAAERARVRAALQAAVVEPPRPVHFQSPFLGPDGERRWIAWDSTSLRDAEGTTFSVAIVGCDITEFKALEAQFHQAQKLEHIGRMTGGIAHDFNNLLTVVMGHTGVLLDKTPGSDAARSFLLQILGAAEKGAALTERLFTFSRHRVLRPEILDPGGLIADDLHMIRHLAGDRINVVSHLDDSPAFVHADAGQVHQILLNLVVNARDAMQSGGTLTISTSNADSRYVQIAVADTGTGMTDEVRSHLFEPFYTTKAEGKGTGLGLSMVYGIVQQSGGHIEVDTNPGTGTSIRIFLPQVQPPPSSGLAADAADAPAGGTETILLIEDQPDVRTLAAGILRDLGYRVLEAQNPIQSLQWVPDLGGDPVHLVVIGLAMPNPSVEQLARTFAESRSATRVLWLQKPFTRESLATAVRESLDRQ
uniref:histidine kinase n=1 Tax=Solibacter usitatus (strain Ellin6076) TaxID=234267 RepID=Q01YP3_SOLUE